jgi:hypothetical protein
VKALWRHRPSPATVLAALALVMALGGTGYAAITLPANSVGTTQLKKDAVTSLKVKNGSLLKADFKAGQVPAGATGPAGPAGPAGAAGAAGAAGPAGPAGPFPDALPSGKTVRGAYNIGATAAAAGALANTSISFIYALGAAPTVKIVLQGAAAPAECPGNATFPQAQAGVLCIYEESRTNTAGVTLNAVNRSGATIFVNSTAAGGFFSYGTWAATGS